jgi:hypothetical protein
MKYRQFVKLLEKKAGEYVYEYNGRRILIENNLNAWFRYNEVTKSINGELETFWEIDRCYKTKKDCLESITRYEIPNELS